MRSGKMIRSSTGRFGKSGCCPSGDTRFLRLYRASILAGLCYLLLLTGVSPLQASSTDNEAVALTEIAQLSRGGASELALTLLDSGQSAPALEPGEWMRWERLRLRILEEQQQWGRAAERLAYLPGGLPQDFTDWAMQRRAIALMHLGDYSASRQLLRGLLWREDPAPSKGQIAEYRHWLAQGYLLEGRTADALVAMQRYQQDYGSSGREAQILRARVLLSSDRAADVGTVLAPHTEHAEAALLQQLAALRSGEEAGQVLARLDSLQARLGEREDWQVLHAAIQAEAADMAVKPAQRILALQRYLSFPPERLRQETLFAYDGDTLWQAWSAYGLQLGNKEQLLIGDDEAWLAAADATTPRYPVRKRALYAVLAQRGSHVAAREQAHQRLAGLLLEQDGEHLLLPQLYLHAPQTLPENTLPESIAHLLVDQAIRSGDLQQAASLMQQLAEPPGGTARFAWQMRRAKVFILAADFSAFDALLEGILPEVAQLGGEQRDQLIQLLFDLQNVGEHQRAYALLEEIYRRVPLQSLRRELLFWMADSRAAQGEHTAAARLYLQSATQGDVNSMDPWAQTARYQAANSLGKAGLLQDARFIYRQLLRVTDSPERRAVLMRELEQVQMRLAAGE